MQEALTREQVPAPLGLRQYLAELQNDSPLSGSALKMLTDRLAPATARAQIPRSSSVTNLTELDPGTRKALVQRLQKNKSTPLPIPDAPNPRAYQFPEPGSASTWARPGHLKRFDHLDLRPDTPTPPTPGSSFLDRFRHLELNPDVDQLARGPASGFLDRFYLLEMPSKTACFRTGLEALCKKTCRV